MTTAAVDVITIAHEHRSGASALARHLGERLGWPVLDDHDLVHRVATRLQVDEAAVESLDERPPSIIDRIGAALLVATPEAPVLMASPDAPLADGIAAAARAEIEAAAAHPPVVIVGHGAQCALRGWRGVLHVNVVAPLAERVARLCAETGWPPAYAISTLQRLDHERAAYVQRHYKMDGHDPMLYDLQVNTGRLPVAAAGAPVVALVEALRGVAFRTAEPSPSRDASSANAMR